MHVGDDDEGCVLCIWHSRPLPSQVTWPDIHPYVFAACKYLLGTLRTDGCLLPSHDITWPILYTPRLFNVQTFTCDTTKGSQLRAQEGETKFEAATTTSFGGTPSNYWSSGHTTRSYRQLTSGAQPAALLKRAMVGIDHIIILCFVNSLRAESGYELQLLVEKKYLFWPFILGI